MLRYFENIISSFTSMLPSYLRLEKPLLLFLLLLIPVLILVFILKSKWRKKTIQKLGDPSLINKLMLGYSRERLNTKNVFLLIGIFFIILGLVNPQIGSKLTEAKREGIDMSIVLDISNSMLAEDLSPNRLERAKRGILQMIEKLKGDRLSIVVFAGQAYTQLPLTTDYAAAKLFTSVIQPNMVPTQGTAIGKAITRAVESFDLKSPTKKVIVILTDGENHEDDALDAANEANKNGIIIHTIGMGSEHGVPIPNKKGTTNDFKLDKKGQPVMTKINESMLRDIANEGHGIYVRSTNAESGLNIVLDNVNKMEKTEFETKMYKDYEDHFQYFIALGVFFILLEFLLSNRKTNNRRVSQWLNK